MSKFKNYRNKYTKNNIIHSIDHLSDMNFGEVSKRRKELTSQYKQIGLPTNSKLQNSSNVVYVHEYTKDDGTFVHAHWRSKPEGTGYDDQGSDPVTPDKMPTKRPEPYPDDSGDDNENGGTVYNLLKWLLIILQAYQLMKSMGNDGNNFVPVNINDSLNNRTDSDYIPNLGVNDGVNDGINKEINTSIDDKKSLKDIENLIIPREEHSSPFSITPYVPKKDEPVQNTQKNLTTNNKVSADKNQPVLTFEDAKQSELQPISQPMAQHSDDDLKRYIQQLLKPATNDIWGDLKNNDKKQTPKETLQEFIYSYLSRISMPMSAKSVENGMHDLRAAQKDKNAKIYDSVYSIDDKNIQNILLKKYNIADSMKGVHYNKDSDTSYRISLSSEIENIILDLLKNNNKTNIDSVEFRSNLINNISHLFMHNNDRYFFLQKAHIYNPHITKDNLFKCKIIDVSNFDNIRDPSNPINTPNNWGYEMQKKGIYKPYFIIIDIEMKIPIWVWLRYLLNNSNSNSDK